MKISFLPIPHTACISLAPVSQLPVMKGNDGDCVQAKFRLSHATFSRRHSFDTNYFKTDFQPFEKRFQPQPEFVASIGIQIVDPAMIAELV